VDSALLIGAKSYCLPLGRGRGARGTALEVLAPRFRLRRSGGFQKPGAARMSHISKVQRSAFFVLLAWEKNDKEFVRKCEGAGSAAAAAGR
jgi:hypothetical protein